MITASDKVAFLKAIKNIKIRIAIDQNDEKTITFARSGQSGKIDYEFSYNVETKILSGKLKNGRIPSMCLPPLRECGSRHYLLSLPPP